MTTLKNCKQAGIKGLSESSNNLSTIEKIAMKKKNIADGLPKYKIVERLEGESFQNWKQRCADACEV